MRRACNPSLFWTTNIQNCLSFFARSSSATLALTSGKSLEESAMNKVEGCVAVVTGANRGLGRAFVEQLLARGAKRIYAGARDPSKLRDLVSSSGGRVVALRIDLGDPVS